MTLKVLCTIGIQDAFTALASTLEQYTGTAIDVSFGVAIMFKEKIKEGADFDVAILTRSIVEDLVASGDIVPSSVFDVARSGLGLAVRQNAPKPDIGTVDSLKRTLLEADSIASSGNGLAGFYFMDVLAELGIAERIRPKLKLDTSGGYAAQIAARGDAQLAVQLVSEIMPVPGVELAGVFPPAVQKYAVLSAGISTASSHSSVAAALIERLRDPAVEPTFAARGLQRTV